MDTEITNYLPDAKYLDPERGDVPGWVLVTLMTIAIATAIWAIAQERLVELFNEAINGVNPSGGN